MWIASHGGRAHSDVLSASSVVTNRTMIMSGPRTVIHGDVKVLMKNGKMLDKPEIVPFSETKRPKRNDTKGHLE